MKKLITILLSIVLILCVFSGCESENVDSSYSSKNDTSNSNSNKEETVSSEFPSNSSQIKDDDVISTTPSASTNTNDIEIIYDDIIYDEHGSRRGAIRITGYHIVEGYDGDKTIYLDFEKVKNPEDGAHVVFGVNAYFYDANGMLIGDNGSVCFVASFEEGAIGKKYRDSIALLSINGTNRTKKIEIVGG